MLFHFLLGFWISQAGILKKISGNRKFRRKLLLISLAITAILIPFYYFWIPENFPLIMKKLGVKWQIYLASLGVRSIWYVLTTACVALYASILISISKSVNEKWFRPMAAFGQMALSNYLLQSLILVPYLLISNNYRNIAPFEGFVLYLVVLSLQFTFSTWWISRYKLGPFEWLLRSFTYLKWQPNKKSSKEELIMVRLTTAATL